MVESLQRDGRGLSASGRLRSLLKDPPAAVVLIVCAAVLGLRRAAAWSNPQFWAEDSVFYKDALLTGAHAFVTPQGGYLHTVLRAVALLAAHVDPVFAPAVFVAAATLLTVTVAGRTLSPRCPLPHAGGLCALAVVLVPETHEVLLNLVNLQWVLGAGLILLLIASDPVTKSQWIHDIAVGAAFGMTGPFCIILAPLFVLRAALRRTRASMGLACVIGACALVQAYMLHSDPPSPFGTVNGYVSYRLILPLIGRRIGGSLLLGSFLGPDTDQIVGSLVGVLTLAGVAFLALRPGPNRTGRLFVGAAFALMLAGTLYRASNGFYLFFTPETRARYLYIPQLLVLWLLIANAATAGRVGRICTVLGVVAFCVNLPRLREPAYVDFHWAAYAPKIKAGDAVTVPVNPRGWMLELPARATKSPGAVP